ncbi:uncharacterized protein PAC_06174 [Phialocephala subalpina]|uniref:Uncharacterized protein n=1 Tax=Phialocephala subalpina TaxID=576137 RepID=A0A1L7WU36_9HELO|nr:uncharacterized protein PAC_06174 [Phialocephala subalpina]
MKTSILTVASALLTFVAAANQIDNPLGFIGFEGAALDSTSSTIQITETRSSTVVLFVSDASTGYSTGLETTTETISSVLTHSGTTTSEHYTTTITSTLSIPTTTYPATSKLLVGGSATTSSAASSTSTSASSSTSKAAAPSLAVDIGGLLGVAAGVVVLL